MWTLPDILARWSQPARRRSAVSAIRIEDLESRVVLSAAGGVAPADAAVSIGKAAVPRINVAGDGYTFNDGIGHMDITQNGLAIHGVIVRPGDEPNGEFDATFKTDKAKVAKGTGLFQLLGEEGPVPVTFKIKFKPANGGGFNFSYRYKIDRNAV